MPTVDEDGVTSDGLDFDGELELDVELAPPSEPRPVAKPEPARAEISMSDIDVDLDEPADTEPVTKPQLAAQLEPTAPKKPLPKPAGAVQPKPTVVQPKPVAAQPKPVAAQPKPVAAQPKPVAAQPKPVAAQPKPVAAAPQPAAPAGGWPDLTLELDEIQFYVDQGLDDDAEAALDDLEAQHPGHPQIAKFRGREPAEAAPAPAPVEPVESAPVEVEPVESAPVEVEPVESEPVAVETAVEDEPSAGASVLDLDIEPMEDEAAAEPLVSFDDEPAPAAAEPLVSFADEDDEDAYLSAIFADPVKPKAKPRSEDSNPGANVAAGQSVDAATAFDLGVAYREMGLVDAAIGQFETAARDPQWRARALTLLGALRVHRGETDRAITDLKEAVRLASTPSEASEAAYELGVLYGVIGDTEAAIQQLLTVAPGYRDRDERLAELGF